MPLAFDRLPNEIILELIAQLNSASDVLALCDSSEKVRQVWNANRTTAFLSFLSKNLSPVALEVGCMINDIKASDGNGHNARVEFSKLYKTAGQPSFRARPTLEGLQMCFELCQRYERLVDQSLALMPKTINPADWTTVVWNYRVRRDSSGRLRGGHAWLDPFLRRTMPKSKLSHQSELRRRVFGAFFLLELFVTVRMPGLESYTLFVRFPSFEKVLAFKDPPPGGFCLEPRIGWEHEELLLGEMSIISSLFVRCRWTLPTSVRPTQRWIDFIDVPFGLEHQGFYAPHYYQATGSREGRVKLFFWVAYYWLGMYRKLAVGEGLGFDSTADGPLLLSEWFDPPTVIYA